MQIPNHIKFMGGCAFAIIFGLLFGWVAFPKILKSQLKKEMALSQKTDVRQMWQKIPFPLEFKVYLFNYTNAVEVAKGAIPIVAEVGPYHFDEWKEKVEVEDHEEDDTITYKRLDTFYFRPDLSGPGLTGEELIVIPHVFIMGYRKYLRLTDVQPPAITSIGFSMFRRRTNHTKIRPYTYLAIGTIVTRDKPAMLNVLGKGINGIFDNPPDVFLRAKALDVLFRGVNINCDRTDFAPKAVCSAIKKEASSGLILGPNNQFIFSIFGMRNGTVDPHVITVKRGMKNVMDVGQVIAVDGETELKIWKDHCNQYDGTDGTVFPPFLTEKDRLQSYSTDLCRSFKPHYLKKSSYDGIITNRYVASIGDLQNDPELQCFCDTPETCPKKGLMDLMKCIKAPMLASMPHYLDSDPSLLNDVKGLSPDVNVHGIEIDFEPISGTPMVARQRIQFNMQLIQNDKLELFKTLPDTIAPIFWIEEGLALNKTFVKMLKHQLFIPKKAVGVLKWLLVSCGTLGIIGSLVYHFKDSIIQFTIRSPPSSKISPSHESNSISIIGHQATLAAKLEPSQSPTMNHETHISD